jgi:hypothetical protein
MKVNSHVWLSSLSTRPVYFGEILIPYFVLLYSLAGTFFVLNSVSKYIKFLVQFARLKVSIPALNSNIAHQFEARPAHNSSLGK